METMGLPPKNVIENSTRKKLFFDSNSMVRIVPNSRGKKRKPASKTLALVLKCSDKYVYKEDVVSFCFLPYSSFAGYS